MDMLSDQDSINGETVVFVVVLTKMDMLSDPQFYGKDFFARLS